MSLIAGAGGLPLRVEPQPPPPAPGPITVNNDNVAPPGTGKILLVTPAFVPGKPLENTLYEGWVYALVLLEEQQFAGAV